MNNKNKYKNTMKTKYNKKEKQNENTMKKKSKKLQNFFFTFDHIKDFRLLLITSSNNFITFYDADMKMIGSKSESVVSSKLLKNYRDWKKYTYSNF